MSASIAEQAAATFQKALTLHQQGRLDDARAAYQHVLQLEPEHAAALNLLGAVALVTNDPGAAVDLFIKAICIDPDNIEFHVNCGSAYSMLSQYEAAIACYDRAIALDPDSSPAPYYCRGAALQQLKRHEAAIASYDQALDFESPLEPEAHYGRATALIELRRYEAAVESLDKAIQLGTQYVAEAHYLRGNVLAGLKQWEAALASYERAIALKPDNAEAFSNRGIVLAELKQWEAALASQERAIALKPDYAEAFSNRGIVLAELKQWEAALASYERAIALKPNYPEAFLNRGSAHAELKHWEPALASYERAITLDPNQARAHFNRSAIWLLLGDYAKGWPEYEWRWKQEGLTAFPGERHFSQPRWLGESLVGKTILLYAEQGLGDTLQFCRYASLVAALGARVILEVQPPLLRLLSGLEGVSQLVPRGSPLPSFDYCCPLLSLPLVFKTDSHSIPHANRYLASEASKVAEWKTRLGRTNKPRIGLSWSGNANHMKDRYRGIALAELMRYLPEGFQYISLQKDVREADRRVLQSSPHILNFMDGVADFADTAALCECLDLVISVDTSVVHLSAALGQRTWVLLPFVPDWRWLQDRMDTPWYPSVTLYRQQALGDWSGVLERLRRILSTTS